MPSQTRTACFARRRSGGVVRMTYAAATPADAIITFATIRAFSFVMADQLRRDPPPGAPGIAPPDWLLRMLSALPKPEPAEPSP